MPLIYHVTTKALWQSAIEQGFYESPSLKAEGFIHCSQKHQVQGVLERYYKGAKELLLLAIDTELLTNHFVFEWSPSTQDTFPHIYGSVNLSAVSEVQSIAG
ncbi:MAG TPA: DUF952 domain-containing protein [Lacibacter sp.]|nr:DUF952 domain-containing protein [Lacibacter sp.]